MQNKEFFQFENYDYVDDHYYDDKDDFDDKYDYNDNHTNIHLIFNIISAVSLFLLLTTFVITRETKYLHGKNVFCHSCCLMVYIVVPIAEYFLQSKLNLILCNIIGDYIFTQFKTAVKLAKKQTAIFFVNETNFESNKVTVAIKT